MRKLIAAPLPWAAGIVSVVALLFFVLFFTGGCEPEGVCQPLFRSLAVSILIGAGAIASALVLLWFVIRPRDDDPGYSSTGSREAKR